MNRDLEINQIQIGFLFHCLDVYWTRPGRYEWNERNKEIKPRRIGNKKTIDLANNSFSAYSNSIVYFDPDFCLIQF